MAGFVSRWGTYAKERFPFPVYLLLSGGMAASGALLSDYWTIQPTAIALAGLMLFFAELRLMDELKDYQKDLIAHPERPLPRGLLKEREVQKGVGHLFVMMLLFSLISGLVTNWTAGGIYLGFTVYLWLMYKEFYFGEALNRYPLLYAISHQIILVPLCLYAVAVHGSIFPQQAYAYALAVLGSFFAYEVCRKLDPGAHPVLKTYLSVYGPLKTSLLVVALCSFAAYFAHQLGAPTLLWPLQGLLVLSLILLFAWPRKFKWVELAATLSLLIHLWAVPIRNYLFGVNL